MADFVYIVLLIFDNVDKYFYCVTDTYENKLALLNRKEFM